MKKIFSIAIVCAVAMAVNAVPAKRGWQTMQQADGTSIEVQVCGDEFYHYTLNRDGQRVRLNEAGMYEVISEAPTAAQVRARRVEGQARRQRKDVGTKPNLAPKGVVILANFKDTKMQASHTQAVFDELCNSLNCTVNSGYPSAGQYFADQSNGAYRPQFDVFGPVTLSNNYAYYGKDKSEEGDDQHATTAVVEACILANEQFANLDFANYDSDNDGYVDFVYVIYAGKGQADGGDANTIWPHNWSIEEACSYGTSGYCTYTSSQCQVDGKKLDNYAMSSELSGSALGGIGTLCHEFGHVIGLPDLYDIEYGTVYDKSVTPNDWNIMDGGSYNADGHCPPNYDPWQKYFFGWVIPTNPGPRGQKLELIANGEKGYNPYQINSSGKQQAVTSTGVCYYIENRQAKGWDKPLTGHGMLIWKVNFNATAWTNNAPNGSSTSGAPLYTVLSASGTKVGWDGSNDNCPKNPFPGSGKVTEWKGLSGKPLLEITESNGVISLIYIEDAGYSVTWMVNGAELEKVEYEEGDDLKMPTKAVTACDGTKFIGWTEEANWLDPFSEPADLFTTADGKKVTKAVVYHALFQ